MQYVTVTGFLGSGKTTLLLQMTNYLAARQKKFAVIINEVGEILSESDFPPKHQWINPRANRNF